MDEGFLIRGVHDAATLGIATGCAPRIIIIARKSRCELARSPV
jgi:hypothetical protein